VTPANVKTLKKLRVQAEQVQPALPCRPGIAHCGLEDIHILRGIESQVFFCSMAWNE
jgi:hypothetical protein